MNTVQCRFGRGLMRAIRGSCPAHVRTSSGIISDFIRRMARKHDLPEFAGVLSTIGANDLALKSMWCSTF